MSCELENCPPCFPVRLTADSGDQILLLPSDGEPQAPVGPTPVHPIVDRIRNLAGIAASLVTRFVAAKRERDFCARLRIW